MAGVVKRRGKWCVDFRDQYGTRRAKFFATKREAADHFAKVIPEVKRGLYVAPAELPTFAEIAERWLTGKRAKAPGTVENYEGQVRNHLLPAFGPLRIDLVTPARIEDFRNQKWSADAGLSRSYVNQLLQRTGAIIGYAFKHDLVHRNAGARELVDRVPRQRKAGRAGATAVAPRDVLTAAQAQRVIAAAAPGLYRTFIQTALLTGCRSGELLGLVWDDIDLDKRTLQVNRSLSWQKGTTPGYGKASYHFGPPKTDSSYRTLDLAPDLVRALKAWKLQASPSTVVLDADEGATGALVFPNQTGKPLHRSFLHKGLRGALDACPGLPRVDLHGLRHTFASIAIGQLKLPPTQVADLLGHKSAGITLEVYAHWFEGLSSVGAMADIASAILPLRGDSMVTAAVGDGLTS